MRLHPTVVSLLKYACWALLNLSAYNDDNKRRIAEAESFSTRLQKHPTAEGLLEQACVTLVNISLQGEELRARDDAFAGYQGVWRLIRGVLQRAGQFMIQF